MMRDSFGRTIRYLRLSVTDACGMRCRYCRPEMMGNGSGQEVLRAEEIHGLVRHLVEQHGLKKVRLTGGEPTGRGDLPEIIVRLAGVAGLEEVTLTTNGLTLAEQAGALAKAGLKRVNVSLDTLNPEKFARMTGVDGLRQVLKGIDAAQAAGLGPVKLNTVVVRGENDHELSDLVLFAAWKKVEIRFIELMPMGPLAGRWEKLYVPEGEMRERLGDIVTSWTARPGCQEAARRYCAGMSFGRSAQVGFISPMSCPFCGECDRIRITADGTYYPCLMDKPAGNLLPALRPMFDPMALDRALAGGLAAKAPEHPARGAAAMMEIGG